MARKSRLVIKESEEELRLLLKSQQLNKNRSRLRALLHLKEETYSKRSLLADHLGIAVRTLEKWISIYVKGGIEDLLLPNKRERFSYLIPKHVHRGLSEVVNNEQGGFRSYVEAQKWVADQYGLELKYNTIRGHLIRHFKTKIKSPRKSHIKKDKQAGEAFLKTAKCS